MSRPQQVRQEPPSALRRTARRPRVRGRRRSARPRRTARVRSARPRPGRPRAPNGRAHPASGRRSSGAPPPCDEPGERAGDLVAGLARRRQLDHHLDLGRGQAQDDSPRIRRTRSRSAEHVLSTGPCQRRRWPPTVVGERPGHVQCAARDSNPERADQDLVVDVLAAGGDVCVKVGRSAPPVGSTSAPGAMLR